MPNDPQNFRANQDLRAGCGWSDGGNDALLAAADADFLLGAEGHTYEVRFSDLNSIEPGGIRLVAESEFPDTD